MGVKVSVTLTHYSCETTGRFVPTLAARGLTGRLPVAYVFARGRRIPGMDHLRETLREAPVVDRGEYQYFVHPVSDGLPLVEPSLLAELGEEITATVDVESIDKMLTAEAMGIHIASATSLASGLPFVIARKRAYGFENEVAVHQETGYGESELYVNYIDPGDRLLVVDDVCSTGNTLAALCSAVETIGAEIVDIVVVIERQSDDPRPELPVPVRSLVTVDVHDGEVVILEE